ncbi:Quinate permease [Cyphellophora attinorum]|uniref:Quinate permease n=1 Tax=Cyphellophora attinorum TaxID=1664694 RepID=A0A0N1H1P8_9EURO|nr:Quinate permease [Phialophora attinorum]KPI38113.1 Quinate permease [Phialophora attinorum]
MTEHFEHVKSRQLRLYNVGVTVLMAAGSLGAGYAAAIIGTTLAQPSFLDYFALLSRSDGTDLIATTNGLFFTGGVLGVITISWLADTWGRLWALRVSTAVSIIAGALLAGSVHIAMFIFARTVAGAGVFMLVASIPMWISETAPPATRGVLADFHSCGILLGYAMASYMGYAFFHLPANENMAWRGPFIVGLVPLVCHFIALWYVPESPRWLLMNGHPERAESTLRRLHTAEEA